MRRKRYAALVQKYGPENIAAEAQRVLEEQVMEVIFPWMEKEKTTAALYCGGSFSQCEIEPATVVLGENHKTLDVSKPR